MRCRIDFSSLVVALLCVLPTMARADSFKYSFTSDVGNFSFNTGNLLTRTEVFSPKPFTLEGVTFDFGSVVFSSSLGGACFLFGTSNVSGNCEGAALRAPSWEFDATFSNLIGVG